MYPNLRKETGGCEHVNRLDLQSLGSQPVMSKNLPEHFTGWYRTKSGQIL